MTNQTNKRKSFIIHKDSLSVLKKLNTEQKASLFDAIADYQIESKLPEDTFISIIFEPFLNQFIRDEETWQNVVERNKNNIAKRWEKKNTTGKSGKFGIPKNTKNTDSESKNDSDSESKNENIPDFIDKKLLKDFFDFRESVATKKKPFTDRAKELIIKHLTQFESKQAGFANLALENSIANSWQGVFEPNQKNNSNQIITKEKTLTLGEQFNKFMEYEFCSSIKEEQGVLKVNMRSPHFIKQIELSDDLTAKVQEFFNNKKFELVCL